MITKLPQTGIWKQKNLGDKFADIMGSFNIDLSSEQGKIKMAPRILLNTASTDDAQLGIPFAIVYNNTLSKWHVGCGEFMFVGDNLPNEAFTQDAASTPPSFTTTSRPDMAILPKTNGDDRTFGMSAELCKLADDGSSWSQITSLGGSSNGAPLIPFKGRLYYRIGKSSMGSIDNADSPTPVAPTNTYAVALNDNSQDISCGKANQEWIFLGTMAKSATGKARVHQWNGSSTSVTKTYEIDAQGVLAMCIYKNTPVIIDSNGVLRILNGGSFVELAHLPFRTGKALRSLTSLNHTQYLCHYNGIVTDGEKIQMLLNTTYADGTTDEFIPSGLWEWNPTNGLFHKGSFGLSKSADSITDYGTQKLYLVGALSLAKVNDTSSNGEIMAGVGFYTDATTTKTGIFYNDSNDTLQKAGCIVTNKIYSNNISDIWQQIYVRFRKFLASTDKLIVKARSNETEPVEATITYTSTTTLTVPTASFTTAPAVGDEIDIIQGTGAGRTAHITVITTSAPNYVITVDETITGATTQTAKARFQKWVKLGSYNAQTDSFIKLPIQSSDIGAGDWIQFKIWFLCTGRDQIDDIIISSKANEEIE